MGSACQRNAAANQSSEQSSSPAPVAAADQAGKARYEETAFNLNIAPKAAVSRGQPAELAVYLTAKAPYHVNQEYPHRFKITASRGLSAPTTTIERDPKRLTPERLEMLVPVSVGNDNPLGLDGELSFSLCTAEKCLLEKRKLTLAIPNG
ncbi:MAG TPA: hypothetical protein VIV60_13875 [Polyangiaceae bacterium]